MVVNLVVALLVGVAWVVVSTRPNTDYTEGRRRGSRRRRKGRRKRGSRGTRRRRRGITKLLIKMFLKLRLNKTS